MRGSQRGSRKAAGWAAAAAGAILAASTLVGSGAAPVAAATGARHWVASWAASPVAPRPPALARPGNTADAGFADETVRDVVFTSVGGAAARVSISNTFGTRPLTVGGVDLGVSGQGAAVQPGTARALTFGGRRSVTIPPGGQALSDPARMTVPPLADMAISIYLPRRTGPATYHPDARQMTYVSAAGDTAGEASGRAFVRAGTAWYFADALDVAVPRGVAGTVVALGDSITEGYQSRVGANARWPNDLARRLLSGPPGRELGVVDEGIGGNRLLHGSPCRGVSALARLNRDALSQAGVRAIIVLEGVNDIGFGRLPNTGCAAPDVRVSAAELIAGYRQIIARAHARGVLVIGATLTPFRGASYWSPAGEAVRETVNRWIRHSGAFDGVADFAAAVADPAHPQMLAPRYDSGDHLHPNDAGYQAMAAAVDLRLLR